MTEPKVRVVRILVYEGTPAFIRNSLAQRQVKEKFRTMDGTITEGYLSGDVGNMTFVKPEEAEEIREEHKAKHVLYKDGDADIPQVICDSNGQVCLDLCKACGKAEAELIDHPFCTPDYPADGGRES